MVTTGDDLSWTGGDDFYSCTCKLPVISGSLGAACAQRLVLLLYESIFAPLRGAAVLGFRQYVREKFNICSAKVSVTSVLARR